MRIVVDLQAVQAANKARGIGRYATSLTRALINEATQHEIVLVVNGQFPNALAETRAALRGADLAPEIRVWSGPSLVQNWVDASPWQREAAALIRDAFIESLRPDVILVLSLFEGFDDPAVTSVPLPRRGVPTAIVLFDLIPFVRRADYLSDTRLAAWYDSKIEHLRHADLLLAISESSRQEAIDHLGARPSTVVNISGAADATFRPATIEPIVETDVRSRLGLSRPFVMYTGGIDPRKNIQGLIRAYASLPIQVRLDHQLAIVCAADQSSIDTLELVASDCGLLADEVMMTGYVSDADLATLYNLCKVFVFPSIHEGFGLPALEAMSCGRAVIGSETTSLPEIIKLPEAMFDPFDLSAIAQKLAQALTDDDFRRRLETNSQKQALRFSWDRTARRALDAMEALHAERTDTLTAPLPPIGTRPKLAYVSPLPPVPSGISDYSADLLRELVRHYEIDVVLNQAEISDPWIASNCPQRSVAWFRANSQSFDRVIYNIGNSEFHSHMFALLQDIPGVVILHDFYLSSIVAHMDVHLHQTTGNWPIELYHAHGYAAAAARFSAVDSAEVVWRYPANLSVLQAALGVVVHSKASKELARQWYGASLADGWKPIPLLRKRPDRIDREGARERLGLRPDQLVVCSFGQAGPTKFTQRLLDACWQSGLFEGGKFTLIFVGANDSGAYGNALQEALVAPELEGRATITGRVSMPVYTDYLAAADVAVQVRSMTRGETSAAVLDCMNYGLATIVNACGSMADLPTGCVVKLGENFSDVALVEAIIRLAEDAAHRNEIGEAGRSLVWNEHEPASCADQLAVEIEQFYRRPLIVRPGLIAAISKLESDPVEGLAVLDVARSVASSTLPHRAQRQIFVDVSELVQRDAGSGIQRVTRNVLMSLLQDSPRGYRVEPVYATAESTYRYARQFTALMLQIPNFGLGDDPIEFEAGDVFLGLDLQPHLVPAHRSHFRELRDAGVLVYFVVYDLLPVLLPHNFHPGARDVHSSWLATVAEADGAIAISKSVSIELRDWLATCGYPTESLRLSWFHLGSELDLEAGRGELSSDSSAILAVIDRRPSFLMVGTLEPRKRQDQALAAFELLWSAGYEINLVIVGRQGWMVDHLASDIVAHAEFGRRLLWLTEVGDDLLDAIYDASTCLIMASEGEGFGLPIIEAARHGLPIVARDIDVFKEVAGEYAFYFNGSDSDTLAKALSDWLARWEDGSAPSSLNLPRISWSQSKDQLMLALGLRSDAV